ncbi:metallophosphoesterase family protein [Actinokineospora pegani]|uniref:metallophosphoesterase family protein n=1 Tax=Actinokineospora pegani TaxID=2654637 RepID=UPI0012EABB65|nr:hypothetical protein [Actinokineospora pegani]
MSLAVVREADAVGLAGGIYDEDIPVVMAAGNHDAESVIRRSVRLPDNVTVLDADQAETVRLEDHGLAVHGQSFATRAVTGNLVVAYPGRIDGLANVGVLHTAVEGAEGHDTYAPCKPGGRAPAEFVALDVARWASDPVRPPLTRRPDRQAQGSSGGRDADAYKRRHVVERCFNRLNSSADRPFAPSNSRICRTRGWS